MHAIDLRSDTVTRPTAAMREAMLRADVGDDVYGEDPTVNALQQRLADDLGFEAGLFAPSGTQANLVGLLSHCQRGDEYLVGMDAHTYKYEGGGAAIFGSIQPQPLVQDVDGTIPLEAIEAAIKPRDPHFARSKLLCLENTWHGRPLPHDYLRDARAFGDVLVVGVNSDRSVRVNKGPARPITPEGERAELIASLGSVDAVTVFDEDTPHALITAVQPDVLVKGADWGPDNIVGRDVVEARGGSVVRVTLAEGFSSSRLIDRVRGADR